MSYWLVQHDIEAYWERPNAIGSPKTRALRDRNFRQIRKGDKLLYSLPTHTHKTSRTTVQFAVPAPPDPHTHTQNASSNYDARTVYHLRLVCLFFFRERGIPFLDVDVCMLTLLLGLNLELITAIAKGHDLGHTPFGHAGDRTLQLILERELVTRFNLKLGKKADGGLQRRDIFHHALIIRRVV